MARTRKSTEQTTQAADEPIEQVLESLPARDEDGLVTAGIVEPAECPTCHGAGTVEDMHDEFTSRPAFCLCEAGREAERVWNAEQATEQAEPRLCECGCGRPVIGRTARFIPGDDAKLKSRLLTRFDGGDESAGAELVERGWRTAEELRLRGAKGADAGAKKAERLRAKLARIDAQIAKLTTEKAVIEAELESEAA